MILATVTDPTLRDVEGLTIATAAARAGKDPLTLVLDLLVADRGAPVMIVTLMGDADVEAVIGASGDRHRLGPAGRPLPRVAGPSTCYGTFARILAWAVRERGLMTLSEAVRRMTALPASVFGFTDRGRIDPDSRPTSSPSTRAGHQSTRTYEQPTLLAEEFETVIVGGEVAVEGGAVVDAHLGRVLRDR